jgi:hypothetical protein
MLIRRDGKMAIVPTTRNVFLPIAVIQIQKASDTIAKYEGNLQLDRTASVVI